MTPQGLLDPRQFIGAARTIALEGARDNEIFLSPDALGAVDILIQERLPRISERFQEGSLDFTGWQKIVRRVAEQAVAEYRAARIRSVDDPEDVLRRVRSMLSVYPFDC
jgi:hypothetical protein